METVLGCYACLYLVCYTCDVLPLEGSDKQGHMPFMKKSSHNTHVTNSSENQCLPSITFIFVRLAYDTLIVHEFQGHYLSLVPGFSPQNCNTPPISASMEYDLCQLLCVHVCVCVYVCMCVCVCVSFMFFMYPVFQ